MSNEYDDQQDDITGINSPNATSLDATDAPPEKERKYRRLWRYNDGLWKTRTRVDESESWRRERVVTLHAISSELELTEYQRKRATTALESIDLAGLSDGQQTSLEAHCFVICAFTANADAKPHRADSSIYLAAKSDVKNPDRFVRVQRELNLSDSELKQATKELRSQFEGTL